MAIPKERPTTFPGAKGLSPLVLKRGSGWDSSSFQSTGFVCVESLSCVWLLVTPWALPHHAQHRVTPYNVKYLIIYLKLKQVP